MFVKCCFFCLHYLLLIPSFVLSVPYSNFIPYASYLISYGTTIGLPTVQPSIAPTAFAAITPYVWSVVPEPAVPGNDYRSNIMYSAAWSSASTVVAVGSVQSSQKGLILRSTTGGSTWSVIPVSMITQSVHDFLSFYLSFYLSFFLYFFLFFFYCGYTALVNKYIFIC